MTVVRRRRFIAAAGVGSIGLLAGCTAGAQLDRPAGTTDSTESATPDELKEHVGSADLPVSEDEMRRGAPKDLIPAITEPEFGPNWNGITVTLGVIPPSGPASNDWDTFTIDPRLDPSDAIIGIERGGEARAYPLKVLAWHEVVNDTLAGPLLVTYCPLCDSGISAIRQVNGQEATFGVSGLLFRNNLVMYDDLTESLWSQIAATAINGPETGKTLELVPSTRTTWGAWQEEHDAPVVLLPPPDSDTVIGSRGVRDYTLNPYEAYSESDQIGLGDSYGDDRLHPKATVLGIEHGGVARAYPFDRVARSEVINDHVGGLPVVVALGPNDTLVGYDRRVAGDILRFSSAGSGYLASGGSRWRTTTGVARDGPYEGTGLRRATDRSPMFFFAWRDFYPETDIYRPSD